MTETVKYCGTGKVRMTYAGSQVPITMYPALGDFYYFQRGEGVKGWDSDSGTGTGSNGVSYCTPCTEY